MNEIYLEMNVKFLKLVCDFVYFCFRLEITMSVCNILLVYKI